MLTIFHIYLGLNLTKLENKLIASLTLVILIKNYSNAVQLS